MAELKRKKWQDETFSGKYVSIIRSQNGWIHGRMEEWKDF